MDPWKIMKIWEWIFENEFLRMDFWEWIFENGFLMDFWDRFEIVLRSRSASSLLCRREHGRMFRPLPEPFLGGPSVTSTGRSARRSTIPRNDAGDDESDNVQKLNTNWFIRSQRLLQLALEDRIECLWFLVALTSRVPAPPQAETKNNPRRNSKVIPNDTTPWRRSKRTTLREVSWLSSKLRGVLRRGQHLQGLTNCPSEKIPAFGANHFWDV